MRVDFSDPELADDPRWLRRSVEFPATDGEEITLVVRIEPEADRGGPQAHVYIANPLLHSLESISLSLDQEAKIVRVPRGFREQVPDGEDAHGPYRPSPPFDRLFDGVPYSQQDNVWNRRVTTPFLKNDTFKLLADERPRHAAVARLKTLYDGELRYADHHLSRFLDRMTELRLFDETAIVVTSDHGEEFFEHGFTYHNNILHEEKIRIPLILKPHRGYPVRGPKRVEGPVDGVLNLFPTVLELVGLPAPEGLHGTSLMPRVDASAPEGTSILFHDNEWFRAVRSGPWKFVTTTLSQEKADKIPEFKIMGGYEDMLFHLESDPRERVNLIDREPQVAQRLRELLERKFTEITRRREQAVSGWEANQRELDEKTQERLRALGYLD
ncbi:MAG: sulfatase-like hydrolase/transferase [bacterium]|nr:sulfatase-like hydrolase/transferase [bacterium]